MGFVWEDKHTQRLLNSPHLLGYLINKTKLTPLHSDWIKYIWKTNEHRSLQGHRGSYKTTAMTIVGPIWWLLFHPSDRIAICRKSYSDAADCVGAIRQAMLTTELQAVFYNIHKFVPDMVVKREGSLSFNFKRGITPEGNIDAFGIDTGIVGSHYDKIICDDIITIKDRLSKAEREKTISFIREVRTNIVDPGKPCSFIGTPWHTKDGWLDCPDPIKFPVNSTGILNKEQIEAKKKTTTPVLYASNYELVHQTDDQALFANMEYDHWQYDVKRVFGHLDAAFDGDHYNALTFMAERSNGDIQAVGFSYAGNVKNWYEFVYKMYKKYRCERMYNELNPDKGFTADALSILGIRMSTYTESQNKHNKISTFLYEYWSRIKWAPETDDEYAEQIVDYRKGQEPDDAPDSAGSLLREAFEGSKIQDALFTM